MVLAKRILMGEIVKAHGLRGEVKLKSFAAEPMGIAGYALETETGAKIAFASLREGPGMLIARVEGANSREAAEALKGTRLYVAREALPKTRTDEFYHADLIGLSAREGSREVGRVSAVHDFGAGGVIEIAREGGETLLVSFSEALVPEVNIAGGYMRLAPEALS